MCAGVYNDIGRTTCAGNPGLNVSDTDDKDADEQLRRDCDRMANVWKIDSIKVNHDGMRERRCSDGQCVSTLLMVYLSKMVVVVVMI